ncbi:alpha/beta hydrolase [Microbulbifer guangxiensis]|uniref:alpha/beta hydrolase n=1 Tax=Microbulbifer guangxiensis TaxID=2904249 RepID=UPI001EED6C1F|nr:alpha/beta hydrolase-fold protein [Microbulbifer guangxiensis]
MRRPNRLFALPTLLVCLPLLLLAGAITHAGTTASTNVQVLPPVWMEQLQRQRVVRIYLPADYATTERRYPVLYMHDGQNLFDDATAYAGEWGVDETLSELREERGLALIVVGIDHGGEARINELKPFDHQEYGPGEGDAYLEFLVRQLKPRIDREYRTLPGRDHTAIMGSSLGGLMSHVAISRYPEVFSRAGIFSPAYWIAPGFFQEARQPLPVDSRLYLLAGGREGDDMVSDFRDMHALLKETQQASILHRLAPQGEHTEGFWRAELKAALEWLFAAEEVSP